MTMTIRIRATALFCLCAIARSLSGQTGPIDPMSIPSGTEARIALTGYSTDYIEVTVIAADRDSLRYRSDGDTTLKVLGWQGIGRMDVTDGRHSNFLPGAGIGALIGLAAGVSLGSSAGGGDDPGGGGTLLGMAGVVFGGILGGVIGLFVRTENWTPVSIPRAQLPRGSN
jgi:hypothetical protein